MLKYSVNDINEVDESLKSFYKEAGDKFVLDVDVSLKGEEGESEKLKIHNQKLLAEKKRVESTLEEIKKEKETQAEERAKKVGDYESLLQSSEQKRSETEKKLQEMIEKTNQAKLDSTITEIANELCDGANAMLIKPHIAQRLKMCDDSVSVLDKDRNATISSLEDLKEEFRASSNFKHIIRGTKASGGGAAGGVAQQADYSLADKIKEKSKTDLMGAAKEFFDSV